VRQAVPAFRPALALCPPTVQVDAGHRFNIFSPLSDCRGSGFLICSFRAAGSFPHPLCYGTDLLVLPTRHREANLLLQESLLPILLKQEWQKSQYRTRQPEMSWQTVSGAGRLSRSFPLRPQFGFSCVSNRGAARAPRSNSQVPVLRRERSCGGTVMSVPQRSLVIPN